MDGSFQEIRREEALGIFPSTGLLQHHHLKSEAIFFQHGKIYPVLGPLPKSEDKNAPQAERPWILLFESHGQVIKGLPTFDDDITLHLNTTPAAKENPTLTLVPPQTNEAAPEDEESRLLKEMEELLKGA